MSNFKDFARATLARLPTSARIRLCYLYGHGRLPNLAAPKRFSEKIQWRKLNERNPAFALRADKVAVKAYVCSILGPEWVIPTIWAGTTLPAVKDWPFPIILKANHASGGNLFLREEPNWESVEAICRRWLATPFPAYTGEDFYNEIPRQILVEPLIGENINDYKFFVFNGRVEYIQVDADRFIEHKRAFYNRDWVKQPFSMLHPMELREVSQPPHLKEMIEAAEKMGREFSFVRIDFYDVADGPKFGEITFAPESGYGRISPPEYDLALGALWDLTSTKASIAQAA